MSMDILGDDVWEYNAPQYVDFAAGEDDPNADAWFGKYYRLSMLFLILFSPLFKILSFSLSLRLIRIITKTTRS